jgi:hypothetical protein
VCKSARQERTTHVQCKWARVAVFSIIASFPTDAALLARHSLRELCRRIPQSFRLCFEHAPAPQRTVLLCAPDPEQPRPDRDSARRWRGGPGCERVDDCSRQRRRSSSTRPAAAANRRSSSSNSLRASAHRRTVLFALLPRRTRRRARQRRRRPRRRPRTPTAFSLAPSANYSWTAPPESNRIPYKVCRTRKHKFVSAAPVPSNIVYRIADASP